MIGMAGKEKTTGGGEKAVAGGKAPGNVKNTEGMTVKKSENFSDWYNEVVLKAELADYAPIQVRFVPKEFLSASDMVSGADVVVESASTIGIEAACQRVPVVEYFTYAGLGNLKRQTGSVDYEPCQLNIAEEVLLGVQELSETLDMVLHRDGSALGHKMLERQRQVFPKPAEKGVVVKAIVSTLKELCK